MSALQLIAVVSLLTSCQVPEAPAPPEPPTWRAAQASSEDPAPPPSRQAEIPPEPAKSPKRAARGADFYDQLRFQVPDPIEAQKFVADQLQTELDASERKYYTDGLEYITAIDRPGKIELTLEETIQRALDNSYAIRIESYNPAIWATSVVEAEAAFDAVVFNNSTFSKANRPTATALQATDTTNRSFSTGIRKLLPSGMGVEASWNVIRDEFDSDFVFAELNPSYRNELAFQIRQPFLRGFGLDFNRAQINIFQYDRTISEYEFNREVQDQLLEVERAYWTLLARRRILVIESRLIAQFQRIYDFLLARQDFDASRVEISQSKAQLDIQIAAFARVKQDVLDAEDNLKNLLNDPQLNLVDDLEIVPTEFPTAESILLDRIAELQGALDNRQELHEAELRIEQARIGVGVAKNQAMPRFDVLFNYTFDALGKSQHDSFQNLGDFDFHNYTVGLQFEVPIGNRGPRAAVRRARLEYAQALAALKRIIEGIILEVNIAIREMDTSYEQIGANLTSVESQMDEVEAIEDRAERRDPDQLNRELNAWTRLAGTRRNLVQSLATYNLAIAGLERAKGTLLEYDGVAIGDTQTGR